MKKSVIIFLILSILMSILAYAQFYDYAEVDVRVKMRGEFDIDKEGDDASIKYITANLSFFPRDNYRQEVGKISIIPRTEIVGESILYRWDDPEFGKYGFKVDADVKLKNVRNEIKTKVNFPLRNVPKDISKYLKPSATIDSDNEDIIRLANLLAQGEDDLFVVLHKLAEWTRTNIEYNLSTLTISVSEPASWVLENRNGVCDELTNLFIALCRSLGIPAKFVAGIAHSDSDEFVEDWGPHGWAEVYFPEYGWVDYDVTFGEFGFISPGHIKLKDSIDATQSSTKYSWLGHNVDIKTTPLDMNAEIESYLGEFDKGVEILAYPEKEETGPGSYNLINLKLTNNNDYYISEEVHLYKSKEIKIEESIVKNIVLGPNEEKEVYWIVAVGWLETGYIYTFPVTVLTIQNKTSNTFFKAGIGEAVFSKDDILNLVESREEEAEKEYSKIINLSCIAEKEEFYIYEDNRIVCILKNNGNVFFENMEVCFKEECIKIELGISQEKEVIFEFNETVPGKKEKEVKASSIDASKTKIVKYTALDSPKIIIANLKYPKNVTYNEDYVVEFLMKKESLSNPQEVEVTIDQEGYEKTWVIDEMQNDRKFIIDMTGKNMVSGENEFEIRLEFKDNLGNNYKAEKSIDIDLVDLTLIQRVLVLSNSIGKRVLSRKGFIEFISVVGIMFIVIFFIVFKKNAATKEVIDDMEKVVEHERREESEYARDNRK